MNIINLLKFSVPVFIAHIIEEYVTGIVKMDSFFQRTSNITSLSPNTIYFGEHILIATVFLWTIYNPKRWLLVIIGAIFLFELTHVTRSISTMGYYPGLITALMILTIGVFYWKELIKNGKY